VEFDEFKGAIVTTILTLNETSLKEGLKICSKKLIKDIKHCNKTFHWSASQEVKK